MGMRGQTSEITHHHVQTISKSGSHSPAGIPSPISTRCYSAPLLAGGSPSRNEVQLVKERSAIRRSHGHESGGPAVVTTTQERAHRGKEIESSEEEEERDRSEDEEDEEEEEEGYYKVKEYTEEEESEEVEEEEEKVILVRCMQLTEWGTDFTEIPLGSSKTIKELRTALAKEFELPSEDTIVRIRKLPNIIICRDQHVSRLKGGENLEVIIKEEGLQLNNNKCSTSTCLPQLGEGH